VVPVLRGLRGRCAAHVVAIPGVHHFVFVAGNMALCERVVHLDSLVKQLIFLPLGGPGNSC
jgi:hypothetical protein